MGKDGAEAQKVEWVSCQETNSTFSSGARQDTTAWGTSGIGVRTCVQEAPSVGFGGEIKECLRTSVSQAHFLIPDGLISESPPL